ncbi:MAG: hypothetical protein C4329_10855 [Chitinophagaceae bacterium]
MIATAIRSELKGHKKLTYTALAKAVHQYFNEKNISFDGSVEWYTVTVKNDMEARGIISVINEKGKKLNSLSN